MLYQNTLLPWLTVQRMTTYRAGATEKKRERKRYSAIINLVCILLFYINTSANSNIFYSNCEQGTFQFYPTNTVTSMPLVIQGIINIVLLIKKRPRVHFSKIIISIYDINVFYIFNNQFIRQRAYVEMLSTRKVWRARKQRKSCVSSNPSLLSALKTSQGLNISTYAQLKHELIIL